MFSSMFYRIKLSIVTGVGMVPPIHHLFLEITTNLSCAQIFDNAQLTKGAVCYFLPNSEPDT